ncbi:MAG: hypothetical protein BWY75_03183 [bacterium ADurb.Bin425]|nr:MAG: hypothetical protein BWY75_03183 [bacterium ADurb.Bin425]
MLFIPLARKEPEALAPPAMPEPTFIVPETTPDVAALKVLPQPVEMVFSPSIMPPPPPASPIFSLVVSETLVDGSGASSATSLCLIVLDLAPGVETMV